MNLNQSDLNKKVEEFKDKRNTAINRKGYSAFGINNEVNLTNYYWFENRLSKDECQKAIDLGLSNNPESADTFSGNASTVRKSNVSWLPIRPDITWLLDHLKECVLEANEIWGIEYCGFWESIQFTHYNGVGSHYDFHLDIGPGHGFRKISIVVQLSDPNTYEGGDLIIDTGSNTTTCPRGLGNVILFPSILIHKVTPVTKGERFSLVSWVSGPNWK